MYIDQNFRAAKLPARTPPTRFATRSLASSLAMHVLVAAGLILLAERLVVPAAIETPPIPMVFAPPETAPAPPAPEMPPIPPPVEAPPQVVEPAPVPEPAPVAPPVPQVAPAPPPPVVHEAPVAPPRPAPHRRAAGREPPPASPRPRPVAPEPEAVPQWREAPAEQVAPRTAPPMPATESGPVVPPRPLSAASGNRQPDYPDSAQRRGEQGQVVLRVDVTVDGRAERVSILKSSGFELLDQSAAAAVRGWRFIPATRAGRSVAAAAMVPVNFRLPEN